MDITIDHLYPGATYPSLKAISLASQLTADERREGGDFTYVAEVRGAFGRVAVYDGDNIFVGYF